VFLRTPILADLDRKTIDGASFQSPKSIAAEATCIFEEASTG
jgi:hypothetical protein